MKQIKRKVIFCFLPAILALSPVYAQNMNSPYSVYGIGDIDFRSYNRTSAMGNTGLALSSSFYLIDNNPASITGLTRSFYLVDASAIGKSVQYKGDPINADNSNNKDFWIKRFGMAVKINKSWASAAGIRQFSNINYKFIGSKTVEGSTTTYITNYEGDGGLNEYYWTHAVSLGKHFSLGLTSSVIAGTINQTETISDEMLQTVITTKQQDYFGQLHFNGGVLYSTALNKKWDLSVGGRFSPKTKMLSDRLLTVTENGTDIVKDEFIKNGRFYLPNTFAGGIAFKYKKKTTFALDYTHEDWSSLHIKEQSWQLVSSNRISAGVEFSQQRKIGNLFAERKYFQLGGFFSNSYLQIRNTLVKEFGLTAGMGGAINSNLMYNLSLEAGTRGTTRSNLIKENYIQLTIGLSFRDYLFSKGKKYD